MILPSIFTHRNGRSFVIVGLLLATTVSSKATNYTWTDANGDNNWSTAGNWTPISGPPGAADTAIFDTTGGTTVTIGSVADKVIDFGASASSTATLAYTLGTAAHAGTITISAPTGSNANSLGSVIYQGSSTATETINADILYTGNTALEIGNYNTAGTLTFAGNISSGTTVLNNFVFKGTGNINLTGSVGGAIGSGNAASNGLADFMTSGTLLLSGANTGATGSLTLGGSPGVGGNILIETNNPWGSASNNLLVLSSSSTSAGTFQFSSAGTNSSNGLNVINSFNIVGLRAAGNAATSPGAISIENVAGYNTVGTVFIATGAAGSGYVNIKSDAGTLVIGAITNNVTTAGQPETALLYGAGNGVVSGLIKDANVAGSTTAIVKDGAGTWTLSNSSGSTYTGGTKVIAGMLTLTNATGSATGTGGIALGAATLSGTGTATGVVTASGASGSSVITPATTTSIGALTLGGVTSSTGLTLNIAIDGTGATNSSLTLGTTGLNVSSGALTLNLYDLGTNTLATDTPYTIVTGSGAVAASSLVATLFNSNYTLEPNYGTNGILISGDTLSFEVTTVPEPGTGVGAALLGGVGAWTWFRRGRREARKSVA